MKSIVFLSRDRVDNEGYEENINNIGDPDKVYTWQKNPTVDKNGNFNLSENEGEGEDVEFDPYFDVDDKLELLEWMIGVEIKPGTLVKLKIISEVSHPETIQDRAWRLVNSDNPQEMRKFLKELSE